MLIEFAPAVHRMCVREKSDGSLCCDTFINITLPPTPRSLSKFWAMDVIRFSFAVRLLQVCFVMSFAQQNSSAYVLVLSRACGSRPCIGLCELELFGSISFLSSCFATTGRLIGLCERVQERIERQMRAACELWYALLLFDCNVFSHISLLLPGARPHWEPGDPLSLALSFCLLCIVLPSLSFLLIVSNNNFVGKLSNTVSFVSFKVSSDFLFVILNYHSFVCLVYSSAFSFSCCLWFLSAWFCLSAWLILLFRLEMCSLL